MSATGTVKSFNGAKGFGFIDCHFGSVSYMHRVEVCDNLYGLQGGTGTDVFIHIKDRAELLVLGSWLFAQSCAPQGLRRWKSARSWRCADAAGLALFSKNVMASSAASEDVEILNRSLENKAVSWPRSGLTSSPANQSPAKCRPATSGRR